MINNIFNIEKKNGDSAVLDGRVTVYARIDIDPEDIITMKHPVVSMAHGGLIAAQGNYREQTSLRDFLRDEMGISLDGGGGGTGTDIDSPEDGLKEMIDNMEGLEAALDPKKLRERLENMGDLEEFIPTPPKIVPFHSEQEILIQEGDVYYVGVYKGIGNAVLAVNAVPIIYQALFREQQALSLQNEIESLINQIEGCEPAERSIADAGINPEEELLKTYIPSMLYRKTADPAGLESAKKQFRSFMRGYRFNDDVEAIASLITENNNLGAPEYKLLELYAKKIALVQAEEFAGVGGVCKEIQKLVSNGD